MTWDPVHSYLLFGKLYVKFMYDKLINIWSLLFKQKDFEYCHALYFKAIAIYISKEIFNENQNIYSRQKQESNYNSS